jgi:hypothetical protein
MSKRLSRRDYFAAAALAGGLEQGIEDEMGAHWWHDAGHIARRAYEIADAMCRQSATETPCTHDRTHDRTNAHQ